MVRCSFVIWWNLSVSWNVIKGHTHTGITLPLQPVALHIIGKGSQNIIYYSCRLKHCGTKQKWKFLKFYVRCNRSQDISARIVSGLGAGEQRICCFIPSNNKIFLPFPHCLNLKWRPRSLLLKMLWFLFSGITRPEREDHLLLACSEIKIIGAVLALPHTV